MRQKLTGILLFCAGLLSAGQRVNEVSGPVKDAGALEIVIEQPIPVVNYAAKELQTHLKQATGQQIPIVKKASGGKTALILGDCPSVRAAGIEVSKLPDEGYRILRQGNRVYIAGKDDPKQDPARQTWFQSYPRGTLSGMYDFLERFAGARFFFPGQYGTIVPAKNGLFLPEKINIQESPDMQVRTLYPGTAKSYDPQFALGKLHGLTYQRLRLSEKRINFTHGLGRLNLIERFSKTHPEYFALRDDGKRYFEPWMPHTGQLCLNSGVREEIYQDVKAFLTGQPASSRGMKRWHGVLQLSHNKYISIMPQDGMYWCRCEKCRKICDPKKAFTPEGRQAISNFIFRFTTEIADRLKKEGIEGSVTQMAYQPYDKVPDCKVPKNVLVQVAVNGTVDENRSEDGEKLRGWKEKTGSRVSTWTYAMGKHMSKAIPGLPQMMPKEAAKFITTYRDCLDGVFWESETEEFLFNYLNYYIVGKMMWNSSLDADKLLDDHYSVMFGKGAPMVKEVFEELEKCWVKGVINHTVMDELGPRVQLPSDWELWTKLYSPEKLARFEKLFDQAQRAAASDKGAVERLKFIRKQILGPVLAAQRKFQATQDAVDSWIAYCPGSIWLRPYKGEVNEVNTKLDIARENDALVFRFDCEEPRMNDLLAKYTGRDNPKTYFDSAVEILINPSGDRKNYYHFIVNVNGALADYRCEWNKKGDISWNSSATAKVEKGTAGWKVEVRIPLKDLGPLAKAIPVNFARHRALTGNPRVQEVYYHWSPQPAALTDGFHAIQKWGTLSLEQAPASLIPNGDFSKLKTVSKNYQEWICPHPKNGQVAKLDNRVFMSGGQSLYFKNVAGERICAFFNIPGMKPKTKYRLSYYLKTNGVKGKSGAGTYLYFNKGAGRGFPRVALTGTYSWHRLTFDFTSPANTGKDRIPILGLWIWFAEGEAWFDKVELTELK